ncbi:hypothetical protein GH5_08253 [Leishmania sp. Ghana 2012 LV757]|uniref:hypothetical protein n=1 Tax=Leishmania sp. Ghana 2012 LV757 TaxID=2803181 RepID=UPI001B4EEF52|nr:hypothetical protein GH5_08253 [Leishmania sp. Ghana 2012 LV757]
MPVGSLSASASPYVMEHSLPPPLRAPRRHYGSGTASSNGGGLSLANLAQAFQQLSSDKEMRVRQDRCGQSGGGDAAASPFDSLQEIDRSDGEGAPRGRSEPALQRRSVSSADASSGRTYTSRYAPPHLGKRPHTDAIAHQPLISLSPLYAQRLATLTEAQFCTELESRLGKYDYSSIMQCLHELVRRLSPLSTAFAVVDVTVDGDSSDAHRVRRQGCAAGKEGPDAEDIATSAARALMANHRLLTAVLSALNRMDLYVMETEMSRSPHNVSAAATPGLDATPTATLCADPQLPPPQQQQQQHRDGLPLPETPFSARLCRLLLQWLSREVSCMGATVSLQVLHLLGQQRLFHGEAVLETLVDAIVVHLQRCGSAAAAPTRTESAGGAFTLEEYSLLFDALARFQAQLLRLSYLRQSTEREHDVAHPSAAEASDGKSVDTEDTAAVVAVMGEDDSDPCLASAAAAVRRRALEASSHPVANGRLFHRLAEALSLALWSGERRRLSESTADAATASIDPADASARLLKMNATSFLFLIRALSKLQWWHDGLAAALAAPLTGYVRAHPESALVVVKLVGRRENRSGDVALLEALQDGLLTLLLRRRSALKASGKMALAPRQSREAEMDGDGDVNGAAMGLALREAPHLGNSAAGESPHRLAEAPASGAKRAHAPTRAGIDDAHDCGAWEWGEEEAGEEDEAADMRLFTTTLETHCTPRELLAPAVSTVASTPRVPAPAKSASDSAASLTLIDLHALPGTIEALCRFHVRTIAVLLPSCKVGAGAGTTGDEVRARIVRRMQELLSLVFDDISRAITSVDAITCSLSPMFLGRVLLTLLEATVQLQQAWGTSGPDAPSMHRGEHASTATAHLPHHPLVIELAYAWMVQVMRSRPPPLPPPASHTGKHTAAAEARYRRIAASAFWRRAVLVHYALLKAGLLCCTRPYAAYASGTGAPPRGRYYMPDDALRAAPRVDAAVQRAKVQIRAERQREAAKSAAMEEKERQQRAATPKYASASIQTSAQRQRSPAASSPSPSPHQQRRRSTAVQPARTTDVFAGYTRALSRLL